MNNNKTVTTRVWIENVLPSIEQDIEESRRWADNNKGNVEQLLQRSEQIPDVVQADAGVNIRDADSSDHDLLEQHSRLTDKIERLTSLSEKLRTLIKEDSNEFIEMCVLTWVGLHMAGYTPDDPFKEKKENRKRIKEKLGNLSFYAIIIAVVYFTGAAGLGWILIGLGGIGALMFISMSIKASSGNVPSGALLAGMLALVVSGVILISADYLWSLLLNG